VDKRKLLQRILNSQNNIRFSDFVTLVEAFGFQLARVSGSHHIFSHPDVREPVNLQEVNGQAKPYQVRQFLKIVEWYNLSLEEHDE
jgi:predicted RNA binding protein YcfA (HicA-like mRNA interferase family)